MFLRTWAIIQIFAFAVLFRSVAFASPLTFNVDGVISDSSNQPLESASVTFRVDVQDSTGTCTLYREDFNVSMTGSNGYFSLVIGKTPNLISGGGTLDKVFSNDGTVITGSSCTYTPSSKTETRKIVVSFNDGGTQQVFSSQDIQSVPYAVEAGQAHRLTTALSGDVSGTQTAVVVDKIKGIPVDTTGVTTGKILKYQGGSFVIADDAVGTGLTSLNGLTATTQTFGSIDTGNSVTAPAWVSSSSTHTLKIPMASGAGVTGGLISNTEYATFLTRITSLTGDVTASGSGAVNVTIGTGKVTSTHILDGTVTGTDMNFTGTNAATTGLVLKDASGKFVNFTCSTASDVLTWTAAGWACQAPAATGITSLNGQTGSTQNLAAAASGSTTTLNYTFASNTHTLNIPMASTASVAAGLVSNTDYVSFNSRLPLSGGTMSGTLNMNGSNITNAGNILMVTGSYLTLPNTATSGVSAGQVWYDSGVIKYYDGTTVKTLGTSGGGILSFNGLSGSTQTLATNTTGTDPAFTSTGSSHTLNIPMASNAGANAGLISNSDYLLLKSRQGNALAAGQVWVGNASGGAEAMTLSSDISSVTSLGAVTVTKTTTGQSNKILSLDGSGVGTMAGLALTNSGTVNIQASTASSNYTLKLPSASPTGTQIMQVDALGNLTWIATPSQASLSQGKIWIGNASNGQQAQTMTGDATIDSSGVLSLKNTGTAGTYTRVVTDAQGRVTSGGALLSADVVSALGFTPTAGTNAYVNGGNSFTANATIGLNDNFNLGFKTNSTTQMTITSTGNVGIGTTNPSVSLDLLSKTDAIGVPKGTTAQRPSNAAGLVRYNTDLSSLEYNNGTSWNSVQNSLGYTPLNKAGDAMNGDLTMAAGKYIGLGSTSTAGTVAGQIWYDSGVIKYWDGSAAKTLGVSGAGITSFNAATTTTQTLAIGSSGTLPNWSTNTGTGVHTLNIPYASASGTVTGGLLSNADYVTLMGKQSTSLASGNIWIGNSTGGAVARAMSGDATMDNTGLVTLKNVGTVGTYTKVVTDAQGRVTSGGVLASSDVTAALGFSPSSAANSFTNGGNSFGSNASLGTTDNNNLSFKTNGTTQVTIDTNGKVGIGTTNPAVTLDAGTTTDAFRLPNGTDAQRPTSSKGLIRFNTTSNVVEYHNGSAWSTVATALGYTPVNKAGDAMTGTLSMGSNDITSTGNITMSSNKYLTLSTNATSGTTAGQIWYDNTGVIKYYDGSAVKTLGVAGAGITSFNGATTPSQTLSVPTTSGTTLSWATNTGAGTHTLNIPMASSAGATLGMISNSDYVAFNGKLGPGLPSGQIWIGNTSGFAQPFGLSGDVASLANNGVVTIDKTTTGASNKILALDGAGVANNFGVGLKGATSGTMTLMAAATTSNYSLRFPANAPTSNQILVADGAGGSSWAANPALGYTPVNKAGDTMGGILNHGGYDITNVGSIYTSNVYSGSSTNLNIQAGGAIPTSTAAGANLNLIAQSATGFAGGNIILTPGTGSTKGSVAIGGTPDSNYTLVVGSSSAPTSAYFTGNASTGAAGYFMANNASGTAGQFVNNQSGSYAKFGTGNHAAIFGTIGSAPGYVGIGTSSPTSKLHVSDSLTADPTGTYITSNTALSVQMPASSSTDFNAAQASVDVVSGSSNLSGITSLSAKTSNTTGTGISNMIGVNSQVSNSGTAAVSTAIGVNSLVKNSSSSSMTSAYGAQFAAQSTAAGGITNAYGGSFSAINTGAGTIGQATAGNFFINNTNASGTITTAIGGQFGVNNAGTITTGYGIYIGNVSATTKYALYSIDSTAQSYFAGNVGVGTNPTSAVKLDLSSSVANTLRVTNVTASLSAGNFMNSGSGTQAIVAQNNDAIKLNGHIASTDSTLPTLGSCGSGSALSGTDTRGTVTMGSGTTSCSINFARAFTNNPTCILGPASDPGTTYRFWVNSTTTTSMIISVSTAITGVKLNYFCID